MARRGGFGLSLKSVDFPCYYEGCRETWSVLYTSTTKRERREEIEQKKAKAEAEQATFCLKHKHMSHVPSAANPVLCTTYVVVRRKNAWNRDERALVPADDPVNGSPLHHTIGPGYYLYIDELEVGARVTFTVQVETLDELAAEYADVTTSGGTS